MDEALLGRRWVHVAEEDTGRGQVFRPEESVPLSRRPREWLELRAGGVARLWVPGPADRPLPRAAVWTEEEGTVVVRAAGAGHALRIIEAGADRLVVQRG